MGQFLNNLKKSFKICIYQIFDISLHRSNEVKPLKQQNMKLNIVNVLNAIASEEESVRENTISETHPYEGRTELMWGEEYELRIWKEAQEERRNALARWAHVVDAEDYYFDWLQEKDMAEYWNDIAAKECDRLMWKGEDYSHVHFDKVPTFDEWMEEQMKIISKYMVVAA